MKDCFLLATLIILLTGSSCTSQDQNQEIQKTADSAVEAIQKGDSKKFISLIENLRSIGKNEEMVANDVKKFQSLFEAYLDRKPPRVIITDLYNDMGQRKAQILFYNSSKDSVGIKTMHLNLYFGPPNYVPLDHISGYKLVINKSDSIDFRPLSEWRRQ